MLSKDLLNYIRIQQAQGFSFNQIRTFLEQNGYSKQVVDEHFKELLPKHAPIKPLFIIIGIITLLFIGGSIVFAGWYFSQPVCGNGILEEGENPDTCCVDAGCFGEQTCTDNQCVAPTCGECQYLAGTECLDYECCADSECGSGFSCQEHRCKEVICGYCQYVDGNTCSSYECCEDSQCGNGYICSDEKTCVVDSGLGVEEFSSEDQSSSACDFVCCQDIDCNDGNSFTIDKCQDAGTINAFCQII